MSRKILTRCIRVCDRYIFLILIFRVRLPSKNQKPLQQGRLQLSLIQVRFLKLNKLSIQFIFYIRIPYCTYQQHLENTNMRWYILGCIVAYPDLWFSMYATTMNCPNLCCSDSEENCHQLLKVPLVIRKMSQKLMITGN